MYIKRITVGLDSEINPDNVEWGDLHVEYHNGDDNVAPHIAIRQGSEYVRLPIREVESIVELIKEVRDR